MNPNPPSNPLKFFNHLNLVFAFLAVACLAGSAPAQTPTNKAPVSLPELQQRIAELVGHPRYASALWGVKITSLDTGKTLFATNAEKLCSPASNSKLYTMALALDRFGPDYRIKTSLYARSKPDADGTLKGDLIVFGRGDPTVNSGGPNLHQALEPLVAALTNAGIKQITGDLIGDDSYFRSEPFGSGWDWGDFENYYGAEISALTINSNLVQLTITPGDTVGAPASLVFAPTLPYVAISNRTHTIAKGGTNTISIYHPVAENFIVVSGAIPMDGKASTEDVTMHDPAGLFVALFKEALAQQGITVAGKARSVHWKDREAEPLDLKEWMEIGSAHSKPMRDILRAVQKPSQNLYTDLVFEHIGAGTLGPNSGATGEEAGVRELGKFLQKVGIKKGQTIFEEGSGLSRDNLTTPEATVTLLAYMSRHKDAEVYISALPIAGVDGTLRRRMKGTPAEGNVRAKTGTLRWAHSMSGYVTSAAGERLVFSLMLNRFQNREQKRSSTQDLDAIAVMLAGLTARSDKAAE